MIIKNDNQVELKFGTGDIGITSGSASNDDELMGIVTFSNQTPREVGVISDKKAGQLYALDEFPVLMTFTKSESIDVLIEQLNQAKSDMQLLQKRRAML